MPCCESRQGCKRAPDSPPGQGRWLCHQQARGAADSHRSCREHRCHQHSLTALCTPFFTHQQGVWGASFTCQETRSKHPSDMPCTST